MATVLLIDDDPFFLTVHGDRLRELGHDVVAFQSAADALGADWASIDAVVCDLEMPEMKGTELLVAVRESGATTAPFVFLTGHAPSDELIALAIKYSADYLPKTDDTGELAGWLASKVGP